MFVKAMAALAVVLALAGCDADRPMTAGESFSGGTVVASAATVSRSSREDLTTSAGDRVFFAFDRSALSPEAKATLDRQAAWLGRYPDVNVQIAGNCDERGTEEYNIALGQRRANAARAYLAGRGIAGTRIGTISYGKDRPVAIGANEAAWRQNRNAITEVR